MWLLPGTARLGGPGKQLSRYQGKVRIQPFFKLIDLRSPNRPGQEQTRLVRSPYLSNSPGSCVWDGSGPVAI